MTTVRRGRYVHDIGQFGRDVLQSGYAKDQVHAHAETAMSIFEAIVPRDDDTWADSVSVSSGVKDRDGLRAVAVLRSSDPDAAYKELGHYVRAGRSKGERAKRGNLVGPLQRGVTYRFVRGAHSMTKAMAAACGGGGQVRTRGRR